MTGTNRKSRRPADASASRFRATGAALVVSLVLLLAMTILGLSSMSTATLELTMANNMRFHQAAFEAAETGIGLAISTHDFSTTGPTRLGPVTLADDTETEALTTFEAVTPVPDGGFSIGVNPGTIQAFHFAIRATGRSARGAVSTHTQGFYVIGPGGP